MQNSDYKTLIQTTIACMLVIFSSLAQADFKLPAIDEKFITLQEDNPSRDAGYVVGDKITRNITLTIKAPYELVTETLPIVGYQHRYKGQLVGMELASIDTQKTKNSDSTTHDISLTYQVFTTGKLAKPAILRAEFVKIRNLETKKVVQYRVPSWSFRISPLSVFGAVKLDEEMSKFIKPLQIDSSRENLILKSSLALLALALLGLLYIFGKHAWLPRMGAPFAKAYRDITKMPDSAEGIKQAVSRVHASLNKTAGTSVFSDTLNAFIAQKPGFSPAQGEIEKFFNLSRYTFFEATPSNSLDTYSKDWLLQLCRHLRDCERGLKPNITSGKQG